MMYGEFISCANCHGQNGHGGTVDMMMLRLQTPNITWTALTDSTQYNPIYTDSTLERAITQGIGSDGSTLSVYMPRWQMSTGDLNDLVSYIHTLS
jgi:mono/diheme cytochrome c family protein